MFFASSTFSINKNRRFCHDIYVVYFILLLFSGKNGNTKNQKNTILFFLLKK